MVWEGLAALIAAGYRSHKMGVRMDMNYSLDSETEATSNPIPSLHGPKPSEFQVSIHHVPEPDARAVPEVTEQVPKPPAQPTSDAGYQDLILFP
jgi:hypothetical protein